MDTILIVTSIGHIVSGIILLALGVFSIWHQPKKLVNQLFFVSTLGIAIFATSLGIGILLPPGPLAYKIWMFNLVDVIIAASYLHLALAMTGQNRLRGGLWVIRISYAVGAVIFVSSLLFPHLFLPEVTPKLFTQSYLNAGPLYIAMLSYFVLLNTLMFGVLVRGYFKYRERRARLEYMFLGFAIGSCFGPLDFFLVFDIPISPIFGIGFSVGTIPIAYGIITKQLMDIRIVFKRAFIYSLMIGGVSSVLVLLIALNDFLTKEISWIHWWVTPVVIAFVGVLLGRLYWKEAVESELLKSEFVSVAGHKLRTPLAQMRWGLQELAGDVESEKSKELTERIQRSAEQLIDLTNTILEIAQQDKQTYTYERNDIDLEEITRVSLDRLEPIRKRKNISVRVHIDEGLHVVADARRIRSVIEVLIKNALIYTSEGGSVGISAIQTKNKVLYRVRDTGIGVSRDDKKRIFSRFYRSGIAKRIDTDGAGLGLSMSKSIIKKHHGKIGVDSEGEGKGATFWFTLPLP